MFNASSNSSGEWFQNTKSPVQLIWKNLLRVFPCARERACFSGAVDRVRPLFWSSPGNPVPDIPRSQPAEILSPLPLYRRPLATEPSVHRKGTQDTPNELQWQNKSSIRRKWSLPLVWRFREHWNNNDGRRQLHQGERRKVWFASVCLCYDSSWRRLRKHANIYTQQEFIAMIADNNIKITTIYNMQQS